MIAPNPTNKITGKRRNAGKSSRKKEKKGET